jgi:DNA recombination protein RmuC
MPDILVWALLGAASLAAIVASVALLRARGESAALAARLEGLAAQQDRTERSLREQLASSRQEQGTALREVRDEIGAASRALRDSMHSGLSESGRLQLSQLDGFAGRIDSLVQAQDRRLEDLRTAVTEQLAGLRRDHVIQLEAVRETVDARLQQTLEERLGASFQIVSERLEQVHRGLGEMQTLAAGVGDLKRVLSNVRARGTWGEVQLGALLEQALAPDQFAANVATREDSDDRVEYAVRLPGPRGGGADQVWLPIDAKFPLEDYQRLIDASDRGDAPAAEVAARELETRIRTNARRISEKYVGVPRTTDFAILFVPVEGLYAEVLRRAGLVDSLQRDYRVLVAGPTTLWAILTSLRLGFRTLAIQQRSSEVWTLLGEVRQDFARFGATLEAVQKKLGEASSKIDEARRGSRRIQRRLQDVQESPGAEPAAAAVAAGSLFEELTSGAREGDER